VELTEYSSATIDHRAEYDDLSTTPQVSKWSKLHVWYSLNTPIQWQKFNKKRWQQTPTAIQNPRSIARGRGEWNRPVDTFDWLSVVLLNFVQLNQTAVSVNERVWKVCAVGADSRGWSGWRPYWVVLPILRRTDFSWKCQQIRFLVDLPLAIGGVDPAVFDVANKIYWRSIAMIHVVHCENKVR